MNPSAWLWLLPVSMLPFASPMASFHARRPSHVLLDGAINREVAQDRMNKRLEELRKLHRMQDDMKQLVQDSKLRADLLKNFDEKDLQRLREKLLKGGGLSRDQNWEKLLKQLSSKKKVNEQQIEYLRRLFEKEDEKRRTTGMNRGEAENRPAIHASDPVILPSERSPGEFNEQGGSFMEQLTDQTSEFFSDYAGQFAGDVAAALAEANNKDETAPLAELFRRIKNTDLSQMEVSELAGQWADRVPNLGRFLREQSRLLEGVRSLVRDSPPATMPTAAMPAPADSGDFHGPMAALLVLGAMFVLAWRAVASASGRREPMGLAPIRRPTRAALFGVATREDLVRVFEQIARFRLGSPAEVCHHRELARRLAEHGGERDAARRREAAELLAWRYEQARYDRWAQPLSSEEWAEVRHALGFLAGVTAA